MVTSTTGQPAWRMATGLGILLLFLSGSCAYSQVFDIIGLNLLRATTTNLDGTGIRVAQVEAQLVGDGDFEVNPGDLGINLPVDDFSWYSTNASATTFPNSLGIDSGHADTVGGYFYGLPGGVSTNLLHIDNYEADDFVNDRLPLLSPINNDRVVNQCFDAWTNEEAALDDLYDNYAAQNNTLFITGVGDGIDAYPGSTTNVLPPGTCYNGIGVSAYYNTNATSIGPTLDGRAKPDITAPQSPTSDSTPLVSGAAAILQEAGLRGDGGGDTNSATDARTLKALLLNGAIKPRTWSNPSPSPLDPLFGAGILDVFESYQQLAGGEHGYIDTTNVTAGGAHPPTGAAANISSLCGWDFDWITNTPVTDAINHYCFAVTNSAGNSPFTGTMTLVWNRHYAAATINNLDLFLYNMTSGALIASSTSQVDNVEHIYVPILPAGRYDLEVLKHGGVITTTTENYALAFEFFAVQLTLTPSTNGLLTVSWPAYPDGFQLETTSSLAPPVSWSDIDTTPALTNGQYSLLVGSGGNAQYFRLFRIRYP